MPSPVAMAELVVKSYTRPMPPVASTINREVKVICSPSLSTSTAKPLPFLSKRHIRAKSSIVTFGSFSTASLSTFVIRAPVESL